MASTASPLSLVLQVNGRRYSVQAAPDLSLLNLLREDLGLVGSRFGCGSGECGACLVLVDGRSTASCTLRAADACGHVLTTVEGLPAALHQALIDEQAAQCGYCSSGMLVAAAGLLREHPAPSAQQVRLALDDQLCRCGAHPRIVRAVLRAAAAMAVIQAVPAIPAPESDSACG